MDVNTGGNLSSMDGSGLVGIEDEGFVDFVE